MADIVTHDFTKINFLCVINQGRDTLRDSMSNASAAADLVERFRRQRPLRAGSLLVTIFGDSIMPRGGAIALGSLIPLASPFGLNERLVRTATARLAQEGWLAARRVGKRSEYRLSDGGRERFAEATERIYGDPATEGSGRWTLIVLPSSMPVAQRRRLRQEFSWQGFGELGNGVFAHPQLPARALAWQIREANLPDRTLVFEADLASPATPAPLMELGWDLEDLGERYRQFVHRFGLVDAALTGPLEPEIGFIVRTLLIHEYRRLHLRDPLLPARLLPEHWPGLEAAELCRCIYARVFAASEAHLSAVAAQLDGALPPAGPSIMQRFGGFAVDSLR
jgi:phenylacetic acid degradation operon negative regulatory protein